MLRNPLFRTVLLGALLMSSLVLARPDAEIYRLVRVDLTSPVIQTAVTANPDLDIPLIKPGSHAEIVVRDAELKWLNDSGIPYEVMHEDLAAHYAARFQNVTSDYGAYHTYSEIGTWLDDLHAAYPQVVSAKWSIGQTGLGNDLWCVRVSDNPEVNESGEPEILFDGMHHAREIMASEMPVMLIEYLASRYGTDPEITYLLDNREIYVVPVVNPDGSLYNEQTNPNGGGMWRKNRRNNGDGSYGVDPNRNYPYQWVGPGSSTIPSSDTYRGPSAGSEPEVQAMMALVNSHAFVTAQSFHSYSNLTLYPWGYTIGNSPDEAMFVHMADIMTSQNGYAPGQAPELLYEVNGGSFDWVYGASLEHPKCLAFSNEIGGSGDGFWPADSRRQELFDENLWPSLYQIMAAGLYVSAHTPLVLGGDGNGRLDAGETAGLSFTVENLGVTASASDVTVTLSSDDPYITLLSNSRSLGGLAAIGSVSLAGDPIMVAVDPALPASRNVSVHVTVDADGVIAEFDLAFPAGSESVLFSDDFESGTGAWTLTGSWAATSSSYHSASNSLTDTPAGDYPNNASTSATLASPIPVGAGAVLSFWHKYEIESGYDYGYVQASANGSTWTTLASFDGYQNSWQQVEVSLDAFAGQTTYLRFSFVTDYSVTYDGWYIDDVTVTGLGSTNGLPAAPALLSPADGGLLAAGETLVCAESTDPESAPVTYGFRVYDSPELTNLVWSTSGVSAAGGQAEALPAGLTEGVTYYWRAFAADDQEWGLMGETRSFTVDAASGVNLGLDRLFVRSLGATGAQGARLELNLPAAGDLTVQVFNARGQMVRSLAAGDMASGRHVLSWDGRDASGRAVSSGLYFVRAAAGRERVVERLTLVR
ncbi:MAG TPA: M14 family zinc carboxypeptidase [Candidatus Krumholzibacteria bacterium]|nr:M14 family zinc carboxypeptidase [Candidatus Krumholzibacteria bacterium]HRX51816.1 M14 family zinc carboxypeptidase [Candidatus Krumholzibacteria bacterium]